MFKNKIYTQSIRQPLKEAKEIGQADLVVGIPFVNEKDTITHVLKMANKGLETYYGDMRAVIVCVGENTGKDALKVINAIPMDRAKNIRRIAFLKKGPQVKGRGYSIMAIIQIAQALKANLVLLEADLIQKQGRGLRPDWIKLLCEPMVREGVDLVIPRFNRHYFEGMLCKNIVSPLITSLYKMHIREPLPGMWGISYHLLGKYVKELPDLKKDGYGGYGIDVWLVTNAIVYEVRICEVYPGAKLQGKRYEIQPSYIYQVIQTLFDQIIAHRGWWQKRPTLVQHICSYGIHREEEPDPVDINILGLINSYKKGVLDFSHLYQRILPKKILSCLQIPSEAGPHRLSEFDFSLPLWTETAYLFLLHYAFSQEFERTKILEGLISLYLARVATIVAQIKRIKADFSKVDVKVAESFIYPQLETLIDGQIKEFLKQWPHFLSMWEKAEIPCALPPKIIFMEGLIPDLALLMPEELTTSDDKRIKITSIKERLIKKYQKEFENFVYNTLKIPLKARFYDISQAIGEFMSKIEYNLDKTILPYDLHSDEGIVEMVKTIFAIFPHPSVLALKEEMARKLLRLYPPTNLLVNVNKEKIDDLLKNFDAGHILTMARLTESESYVRGVNAFIGIHVSPDDLTLAPLKWLVVSYHDYPALLASRQVCRLDPLTGRVVITNISPGMGGDYPKLFYFLSLGQQIAKAEKFSAVWKEFAKEGKNFGKRLINAIQGHWGKRPLSGYMIFEAGIQELLVNRLRQMSKEISPPSFANRLMDLADSYHLAWTLPDGLFIPCSAFSWASYSFMGGKGVPKRIAACVERDWFSRKLLLRCLKEAGIGDEEVLEATIRELMGEGNISKDLTHVLLGVPESLIQEVVTKKTIPIKEVKIPQLTIKERLMLEDFEGIAPAQQIERIREYINLLSGKRLLHINSTAIGGGVAEILNRLIPLSNEIGMNTGWEVIPGTHEFFAVTKTVHNALQGGKVPWTKTMENVYKRYTKDNFKRFLSEGRFYGDIIIIHDPQPAGMIPLIKEQFPEKKIIWRCHIDLSSPHYRVWSFIRNYVRYADLAIFHIPEFIPKDLDMPKVIMPPSIDPLSPKNIELPQGFVYAVLDKYGIDKARPVILQISRFDMFKDPKGVIEAFSLVRESVDAQLVFAGAMATDDPEGMAILEDVKKEVVGEPDIHILELAATPIRENHLEVNALQRAAAIILQKSLREGFGLTATEGMWKGKPVVAGNVGGLRYQIMDGVTGYLVGDVDKNGNLEYSKEESAGRIKSLLVHPEEAERMGKRAREYVRNNLLITRHLADYLELACWLLLDKPYSGKILSS